MRKSWSAWLSLRCSFCISLGCRQMTKNLISGVLERQFILRDFFQSPRTWGLSENSRISFASAFSPHERADTQPMHFQCRIYCKYYESLRYQNSNGTNYALQERDSRPSKYLGM